MPWSYDFAQRRPSQATVDHGFNPAIAATDASAFMASVYRWMFGGLLLTAGIAYYTATNLAWLKFTVHMMWPLLIAELGLVIALSYLAKRLSGSTAALMFLAYSALTGLTLSGIFILFQLGSIAQVFLITAVMYGAMSVYGTVTKRDLSAWATFLFMGLIGVVVASVVLLFWHSPRLSFVMSCAGVLVFAGLTAYDHQKIRNISYQAGYSSTLSASIQGALSLYLDFVNLFLMLLNLLGRKR